MPSEQEQHFDVFEALSSRRGCLTVPELAGMLGVSKNGLYEQVKPGTLPGCVSVQRFASILAPSPHGSESDYRQAGKSLALEVEQKGGQSP